MKTVAQKRLLSYCSCFCKGALVEKLVVCCRERWLHSDSSSSENLNKIPLSKRSYDNLIVRTQLSRADHENHLKLSEETNMKIVLVRYQILQFLFNVYSTHPKKIRWARSHMLVKTKEYITIQYSTLHHFLSCILSYWNFYKFCNFLIFDIRLACKNIGWSCVRYSHCVYKALHWSNFPLLTQT